MAILDLPREIQGGSLLQLQEVLLYQFFYHLRLYSIAETFFTKALQK